MTRLTAKLLALSLLLSCMSREPSACQSLAAADPPDISARAAVLMDADSGGILFGVRPDEKRAIASITKIMTALVILENMDTETRITAEADWLKVEGSSAGIRAGSEYSVMELLTALMLASGNDAAQVLAFGCAGSIESFAERMNGKAAELGMVNTHFTNPHGLTEADHYSTAADMAKLTAAALRNETFAAIAATKEAVFGAAALQNHNRLLWDYEGANGVKTGFTNAAGRTLVSSAKRGTMRLICVTLNDGNDWADHTALLDWGFSAFEKPILSQGEWSVPLISGCKAAAEVGIGNDTLPLVPKGAELQWELQLPAFVYAPVAAGQRLGKAVLTVDGFEAASFELYAAETVPQDPEIRLNFPEQMLRKWKELLDTVRRA